MSLVKGLACGTSNLPQPVETKVASKDLEGKKHMCTVRAVS